MSQGRVQQRAAGGCIYPHERITNDTAPVLGSTLDVDDAHLELVRETESEFINDRLCKEYRNRISHVYKCRQEQYPDYYEVGVRNLTHHDYNNPDVYHHNNDRDLGNLFFICCDLSFNFSQNNVCLSFNLCLNLCSNVC